MVQEKKRKLHPVQWGLLLIPAAGILWFSQPLLLGVFGIGMVLEWLACIVLMLLILKVPQMVVKGGGQRVIAWILTSCLPQVSGGAGISRR